MAVSLHAFKARHLSIYRELWKSINRVCAIQISFLSISLDSCRLFTSQNLSFSLQSPFPRAFRPQDHFSYIWYDLYLSFFMHFMFSDLTFGIFDKLWGFSKSMQFLWNFWDGLCENDLKSSCIASHLHYNTVSCIVNVCLLCWNDCVLVGLDWAEPMMFVSIAYHMLMHFHAYVLYILYILIYWLYWCFSACLFLSLSLIYISCVMAPKRKSTPSRNLLRFRASTSSDPTPSHVRFRDDKAQEDFFENFSRWGVHSECKVIFSYFSNIDLPTVIHHKHWESLCDILVTCPSVLIQEFYFNMQGFYYSVPLFVTRVRGTHIVVTLDIVSEVLRVPRVVHPDYPGCERLTTVSKDELISTFCEHPYDWGDHQFTSCTTFAPFTSAPSSSMGRVTLEDIMAQLVHMDACLDTLRDELCQVNTRVSHIAWRQAAMGGYTAASPSQSTFEDKDNDDDVDASNADEDDNASSTNEMSTWYSYPLSLVTKRGSSFRYESSYTHRGSVSIRRFLLGGVFIFFRDVVRILCIFFFLF